MSLKDLVLATTETEHTRDRFYARYGMRRNPFPANRTILAEVLHNQEHATKRVAELFKDLIGEEPRRRALGILAGTGGGKTHFLRYCRRDLEAALRETQHELLFVEFQAGSGKLQDLARSSSARSTEV